MTRSIVLALLLSAAVTPLHAQSSTSGSNAGANSGSASNAVSNPTNAANNNIGTSTSTSGSNSTANSGSASDSTSNGNQQGQMQGQNANNAQGQGQTQGQSTTTSSAQDAHNNQSQGQSTSTQASQANGQSTSLTFNSSSPDHIQVKTNTPVGLAASSSFSSDYCGGTVSGGASVAPLGISLGGAGPKYDKSCQALRRAEKFGMAAANAQNMGHPDLAGQLMTMMIWSICTSDSGGPGMQYPTASACGAAGLLGSMPARVSDAATPSAPPPAAKPVRSARVSDEKGKVTPEAAQRSQQPEAKVVAALH